MVASEPAARDLTLAFVSTYPPARCGVGDYTAALRAALRPWLAARVIAEEDADYDPQATRDAQVRRVWRRGTDYVPDVLDAVDAARPNVVHVQHEDGILGRDRRAERLVAGLARRGIAVVVTLHSVYPRALPWPWGKREPARFYRALAEHAALVVHQRYAMAERLIEHGVPADRVEVVAHGTPELELPAPGPARAALELPADGPLALFLGFIHRSKGVDTLLDAFRACRVQGARLVVAGEVRLAGRARSAFERGVAADVAAGRVIFRPGFVAPPDVPRYLGAADVVCLPHRQEYGSSSGVLHLALAAERAVICSDGPKFRELAERYRSDAPELVVPPGDAPAFAAALSRALSEPALRARAAAASARLAAETRWAESARRHVALYRRLRPGSAAGTDPAAVA